METLTNWLNSIFIGTCLIVIGIGLLWAVGAYSGVTVSKPVTTTSEVFPASTGIEEQDRPVPIWPRGEWWVDPSVRANRNTIELDEWHPVTSAPAVDIHDKALQTLAKLDADVKAQALTIQQARAEYAAFKKQSQR